MRPSVCPICTQRTSCEPSWQIPRPVAADPTAQPRDFGLEGSKLTFAPDGNGLDGREIDAHSLRRCGRARSRMRALERCDSLHVRGELLGLNEADQLERL